MDEREVTLTLGPYQATRLARFVAVYRAYAWREVPPSPQRNQTLRAAQAVQGRVVAWRAEEQKTLLLCLNEREKQALELVLAALIQASQIVFPAPEREHALNELTAFRLLLAQRVRATQVHSAEQQVSA